MTDYLHSSQVKNVIRRVKQAQWEGKYGTKEKGYVFKRLFGF